MNTESKNQDKLDTAALAGASANGTRMVTSAETAQAARDAIKAAHSVASAGDGGEAFVVRRAGSLSSDFAKKGLKSGGFQSVKGHYVEGAAIRDYNKAGKLVGKKMVPRLRSNNMAYDASRIVKGAYGGGIQIKSSAAGIEKAIKQIEKAKPGSASRATVLVPDDQVELATRIARGRIRVRGTGFTRSHAERKLAGGLKDLSSNGARATSKTRALGKAGLWGAAATIVLGTARDAGSLRGGELTKRHFAENRAIDAVEGGGGAIAGSVAAGAAGAATTAALGTAAGATIAAGAGSAGTAVVGAVGAVGATGTAATLATITAPVAIPAAVGTAAAVVVGIGVTRAGKEVRRRVEERRSRSDGDDPGDAGLVAIDGGRPSGGGAAVRTVVSGLPAAA